MDVLFSEPVLGVLGIYLITFILTAMLPGTFVEGYVLTPSGSRSSYNLNGLRVLVVVLAGYLGLAHRNVISSASMFSDDSDSFKTAALTACVGGLVVSFLFYLRGIPLLKAGLIDLRSRCPTIDTVPGVGKSATSSSSRASIGGTSTTTSSSSSSTKRGRSPSRRIPALPAPAARRLSTSGASSVSSSSKSSASPSSSSGAKPPSDTLEFQNRSTLEHFWCGVSEFNPLFRIFGSSSSTNPAGAVDIKMWLYIIGAVQLQVNLVSMFASHVSKRIIASSSSASSSTSSTVGEGGLVLPVILSQALGFLPFSTASSSATSTITSTTEATPEAAVITVGYGMAVYAFCLTFFIVEYLWNEEIHTYTYDIFRERIGLKLLWGCLCFYPFFYAIGALPLVEMAASADITRLQAICITVLYFTGWTITRGANMQKFACKQGQDVFLGGWIKMEIVPGSRGRLLCSGFWALSRHINYFGEIIQAIALALPGYWATGSYLPWLYPLYYILLFVPRQADDDAMCAARYGPVWTEYKKRVPNKIIPYIY